MPSRLRRFMPLAVAVFLLAAGVAVYLHFRGGGPAPAPNVADLGASPDWSQLERYHGVLTRREFETALGNFYTLGPEWKSYFLVDSSGVAVLSARSEPVTAISFARGGEPKPAPPRPWRPASALPPAPEGRPLEGVRIAIDPGHIGGDFARLEERWYQIGDSMPVAEGDMTLITARLLEPRLKALGAEVFLVRDRAAPVTNRRPEDFMAYARAERPGAPETEIARFAARLSYRTAEIRARARIINRDGPFRPDLVLCLHFNAERWGAPDDPRFSPRNHFHIILHGAYMAAEIAHDDERFELLHKLFQGVHLEEAAVAREVAKAFTEHTGLPAYRYPLDAPAIRIGPALWARNLLANRLYRCPVLFLEPYVMNNREVFERVQTGDYEGLREVAGRMRKSLYREYADAAVAGLVNYYRSARTP